MNKDLRNFYHLFDGYVVLIAIRYGKKGTNM